MTEHSDDENGSIVAESVDSDRTPSPSLLGWFEIHRKSQQCSPVFTPPRKLFKQTLGCHVKRPDGLNKGQSAEDAASSKESEHSPLELQDYDVQHKEEINSEEGMQNICVGKDDKQDSPQSKPIEINVDLCIQPKNPQKQVQEKEVESMHHQPYVMPVLEQIQPFFSTLDELETFYTKTEEILQSNLSSVNKDKLQANLAIKQADLKLQVAELKKKRQILMQPKEPGSEETLPSRDERRQELIDLSNLQKKLLQLLTLHKKISSKLASQGSTSSEGNMALPSCEKSGFAGPKVLPSIKGVDTASSSEGASHSNEDTKVGVQGQSEPGKDIISKGGNDLPHLSSGPIGRGIMSRKSVPSTENENFDSVKRSPSGISKNQALGASSITAPQPKQTNITQMKFKTNVLEGKVFLQQNVAFKPVEGLQSKVECKEQTTFTLPFIQASSIPSIPRAISATALPKNTYQENMIMETPSRLPRSKGLKADITTKVLKTTCDTGCEGQPSSGTNRDFIKSGVPLFSSHQVSDTASQTKKLERVSGLPPVEIQDLMINGLLAPGDSVLTLKVQGELHTASLLPGGKVTTGKREFQNIHEWATHICPYETWRKPKLWGKVSHKGATLESLAHQCQMIVMAKKVQPTVANQSLTRAGMNLIPNDCKGNRNLLDSIRKCLVVSDKELFPNSCSTVPPNLWDKPGKGGIVIPVSWLDDIDVW